VDARNSIDGYVHSMRSTIEDKNKLADKIDEDDKTTISEALKDTEEWINNNPTAEAEEYREQLKKLEAICNPIISKLYGGASPPGGEQFPSEEDYGGHDEL